MAIDFSDAELRAIGFAAPAVVRLFEDKEEQVLNRILGEYAKGERTDFLPLIAEFATLRTTKRDLIRKLKQHEAQVEQGE